METLYKLTDESGLTRNNTQWGPGVTHSGTGKGGLCGPGYIHAYTHPLLAALLNPIHANFKNPRLWECSGEVAKNDSGLKVGCVSLTTIREIDLQKVTKNQRIAFGILCSLEVYRDGSFSKWAHSWLSGADRSGAAAAWAAAAWAAEAAEAAAWAGEAAARAGEAEAARAAEAAAWAAAADIDFVAIAIRAVTEF